MRRVFLFGLLLLWSRPVEAGRVCLERTTGKLISYQSLGRAGMCAVNASAYGVPAQQLEEREVTDAEWVQLQEQWVDAPARAQKQQREEAKQVKAEKLRQKLGLSKAEFDELREALQ